MPCCVVLETHCWEKWGLVSSALLCCARDTLLGEVGWEKWGLVSSALLCCARDTLLGEVGISE